MNRYEENKSIAVPKKLLNLEFMPKLTDEELVLMIRLLACGTQKINILDAIEKYDVDRELLQSLVSKNLIDIYEEDGMIIIDVLKLFENIGNSYSNAEILTIDAMDRISFLINRQLKSYELELIRKWLEEGYLVENIEIAIQKSVINGVDNFSYVEKVLKNEKSAGQPTNVKIERNIDIY